jgi:hypothetical protein
VEANGRCRSTVAAATESFPLASAPYVIGSSIRVCRGYCVGTTNVGLRAPDVPLFYMTLCEMGPLP